MDKDKHKLKLSAFICVYPWVIEIYGINALDKTSFFWDKWLEYLKSSYNGVARLILE